MCYYGIKIRGYFENTFKLQGYPQNRIKREEEVSLVGEIAIEKDQGVYVGVEEDYDDRKKTEDDGLGDIWQEMSMALECSKVHCSVNFCSPLFIHFLFILFALRILIVQGFVGYAIILKKLNVI